MKKIKYLLLIILILFAGVINVNAEGYVGYKVGDKITVNVNDTTKLDFYVIEDSNESNDKVMAIYANTFENAYTYEAANEYINTLSDEWSKVETVFIPSMQDVFGEDVSLTDSFDFNEPTWALSKNTYWTSTESEMDEEIWVWALGTTLDGKGNAGTFSATQERYLKPVINVSKAHIEATASEIDKENKQESANTGDLDLIVLGGAMLLFAGLALISFKKTSTNQ